jgi:hypothetical protein
MSFWGEILFWLVMIAGVISISFNIPGNFIIAANALIYAWVTDFVMMSWGFIGVLFLSAVVVEIVEFILGALTAGKYGSSKMGMFGSIIGGFLGAVWGTPILPPMGILLGAFLGAFIGAALFEFFRSQNLKHSLRVGLGAFYGSVAGKLIKIVAAIAMVVVVGVKIF